MKKILNLLAIMLLAAIGAIAQSPSPGIFNYQGVARNSVGNVLINKAITLRLTIHDGSPAGPTVYQESRGVTTNPFGLFNAQVGSAGATSVTGTIAGVNWGVGSKYIQVEIDPNGGSSFINIGTAQIASVPYSLYSSLSNDLVLPFIKTQAATGTTLIGITNSATTGTLGAITGTSASTDANAFAMTGTISSTAPGGFSAGLRGVNNGTGGLGIGVYGSQNGSGWGVYGTTPSGIGVFGSSTSGTGVNGSSTSGVGVFGTSSTNNAGQFVISNAANTASAVFGTGNHGGSTADFKNTGIGRAGTFEISNAANASAALFAVTNGTNSTGFFVNTNAANTAPTLSATTNGTSGNHFAVQGTISSSSPGGFSSGVRGINNGTGGLGIGVYGSQAGSGWGVYGVTPSGIGVHGNSTSGVGVYALSSSGVASYGASTTGESGRFEITNNANTSNALIGTTNGTGNGILGQHTATTGTNAGVRGESNSQDANAAAMHGVITSTTPGGFSAAVRGTNNGTGGLGIGVYGSQAGSGWGVYGTTPSGIGVHGNSASGFGMYGLSTSGVGVYGLSTNGQSGLFEITNAANANNTLTATTVGTGRAVLGRRGAGSGIALGQTEAIRGDNTDGPGVAGTANTAVGVYGTSANTHGVWGVAVNASTAGVLGRNDVANGYGVWGQSFGGGIGVYGTSQTGHGSHFEITNAASTGDAVRATQNGLGRAVYALINNTSNIVAAVRGETNGGGYGIFGQATGNGNAGFFQISNPASTSSVTNVTTNGIGSGVTVQLTNAANGARGVDVLQAGVGPGVFATSAGGNAVWGITSSISAAGVIGDNTFGEAVVGRNRGGLGVGAVVGRNDSAGYGVRGFNTKDGIGVLGQSGISGGTGKAGTFQNVNAANANTTVDVTTNGIGGGLKVDLTNPANGGRGIDVNQAGVGPAGLGISAGGMGWWGITSSISAAGILGDNTFGEAVVGRNRGGNGVGAVVGRNDSSGYGVRGFNTKDGIGVLGQAGISGGTGQGGRFENVNAANPTTVVTITGNGTGTSLVVNNANAGATNLAIFSKGGVGNVARIADNGQIFANGGFTVGGADVAEYFEAEGLRSSYEPGDVLVISQTSDRKIEKSSAPYSTLVSGVYATKPGMTLTERNATEGTFDDMVPMGVIGVIPTKVCLEGGAIKRGDLLVTSSISGVAMKADPDKVKVGQVLGKALQDFNANEIGKINVLVSVK